MDIERAITELQIVTGVVTNDLEYLVYLLLKDGSYFNDKIEQDTLKSAKELITNPDLVVPSVKDWFSNL